jgi:hypothetical protein
VPTSSLASDYKEKHLETPYASRWKHLKTGHVYKVKGTATIEATMTPAVIYGREDGDDGHGWWVRPKTEFLDGRFERIEDRRPCGCTYDEACICDDPDFS